ncbi:MAG: hypothetical protein COY69_00880 [Candidatus Magasanikbacteria bacterium CG_4_10_14_0_8_um_filter_32_14]|uniref:Sugar O-methyltransferase n=1 Tax=Candidatus Magasanikbacteria bacterium CG_4_10_14_0_8_um_filter_32_14 TaxID=1974640 RepID=A0A2M7RA17_9BACT|nr:MAG: hypothetical protein COY69_00880 [Candidatus Magasanikbacteria bacterium CG_4_10_14_0_8_um_filter_32_14]
MVLIKNLKERFYFLKQFIFDYYNLEILNKLSKPSDNERKTIIEFKKSVKNGKLTKAGTWWKKFSFRLLMYSKFFDPRNFLRWEVIKGTMTVGNIPNEQIKELEMVMKDKGINNKVLLENIIGNPALSDQIIGSSSTLLHHACHLSKLLKNTELSINELETVVEFGGGYGSMCRLFRSIGFKGNYVLYDLPVFLSLQKYYLSNLNFNMINGEDFESADTGKNILVSNTQDLKKILLKLPSLFIATWSLSESPVSVREQILEAVGKPSYFLFGYQALFDNIDNKKYFNNIKYINSDFDWFDEYVPYWDAYYLIGKNNLI